MKYNHLTTKKPKKAKRVGRGIAAGQGKTAGRGTKGQGARAGFSKNPGFAGGSNPLMQKLPKLPGFRSHRIKPEVVYTGDLDNLADKTIDTMALMEAKLVSSPYSKIKLLVKGNITKKLDVKLPMASKSAIECINKAGGSFENTNRLSQPKTNLTKKPKKITKKV